MELTKSTAITMENNWFLGQCATCSLDTSPKSTSNVYQSQVLAVDANGYNGLQRLMDTKTIFGKTCHFVNKTAIELFFGEMTGN